MASAESDDIEAARKLGEEESSEDGGQQIQYENGFTGKVALGALFVCLIMMPGAIYLGLVAGASLGSAAQWVTIVLFSEIARRSFLPLKRQEIYCLYYMAGALTFRRVRLRGYPRHFRRPLRQPDRHAVPDAVACDGERRLASAGVDRAAPRLGGLSAAESP